MIFNHATRNVSRRLLSDVARRRELTNIDNLDEKQSSNDVCIDAQSC